MADFVSFVVSVGGFACAVVAGTAWLLLRPAAAAPRKLLVAIALAYTLASIYAIPHLASRIVAAGYRPLDPADVDHRPAALVVLGSGSFTAKDWHDRRYSLVDPVAAARVLEAARIYRFVDARWVISSGGLASSSRERVPSGTTMHDALIQLGIPADRIIVETESRNTHEEAVIVASILAPLEPEQIILVTTSAHMRRSVGAFRAAGLAVVPAIARDPFAADPWADWLIPSELGLLQTNTVVHEALGLLYYAARGWYR